MNKVFVSCPTSPLCAPRPSSVPLGTRPSVTPTPSALPCLSRGFLRSLRVLYGILEEEGGGRVHVEDIEGLWGGPSILAGVPQALRDATATSGGYLSFPRLVKGLLQVLRAVDSQEMVTLRKRGAKGVTRSQSIHNDVLSSTARLTRQEQRIRRHTLTSGIDYNTLRRMKELEQERDALLDGVQLVDRAREWYRERLHQAEQQRGWCTLGHSPPPPLLGSTLLLQIQELNRFLSDLTSYPDKGHRRQSPYTAKHSDTVTTLRHQNHLLTREISVQNERLWKLQRENEALYKELEERHIPRATFI
ncbi:suppressor APC domain-containing protein 1 [Gastrophryne carolinensis]